MSSTVANLTAPLASHTAPVTGSYRGTSGQFWGIRYSLAVLLICAAGLVVGFKTALSAIVAMGFLGAVIGLRYPALGIISVTTLCTLDSVTRVFLLRGGLLRWNSFNYWLLIVMAISVPVILRRKDVNTRLLQWFFILLLGFLFLTPDLRRGVTHILNGITVFGLLIYFTRVERNDSAWYWMAVVNGLLAACAGFLFFMERGTIGYIDRNALSHFPMTALFTAALGFRFAHKARYGEQILALLSSVNFAWVFLTNSRGGTMVAAACLLVILVEMRGVGRKSVMLAVAVLISLTVMNRFPEMREKTIGRIERLFDSEYSMSKRTSGRADLAKAGWNMFLEKPLGVGTGGYARTWARYSTSQLNVGMKKGHGHEYASHNVWMKILSENGVFGFALFFMMIFSFAFVGWRSQSPYLFRMGLLATLCLTLAFQVTEFQAKGLWMLMAGTTVLLHRWNISPAETESKHEQEATPTSPVQQLVTT